MAYETPQYHPVVLASDTTDYQAGTLARIGDAISKGLPAAAASGALSIVNTGLDYFNKTPYNIEETIRRFGGNEMGDYYAENKSAIDMVGFVGTSLVPGSLGIKGLQMARSGNMLGNTSKYLALPATRRNEYMQKALQEVAADGGVVKSILSANRRNQLAWETADQALTAAAFELGVVAAMHDSPIFDDASLSEFGWNMALGVGIGAGIGVPLATLASKGILNAAAKDVQLQMRQADVLVDLQRMGLAPGTDALLLAESILNLPKQFDNLSFTYKVTQPDGKRVKETIELQTGAAITAARDKAERLGKETLALKFNEIAQGNEIVGQSFFEALQRGVAAARETGMGGDEILQRVHGYLNHLQSARAIDPERFALEQRKFYIVIRPEGLPKDRRTLSDMFSLTRKRGEKGTEVTSKQAYYLADGVTDENINVVDFMQTGAKRVKDVFKSDPTADAVMLPDGTLRINPDSKNILRLREKSTSIRMLMDLEELSLTPDTILAFGDTIAKGSVKSVIDAIYVGNRAYKQEASRAINLASSPLEAGARYAWASNLTATQIKGVLRSGLDTADLPLLDRVVELMNEGTLSAEFLRTISITDNGISKSFDDFVDLKQLRDIKRIELLQSQLETIGQSGGKTDIPNTHAIAQHLNTDRRWVEDVIERGYTQPRPDTPGTVYDTKKALLPRTIQLEWDFGPVSKLTKGQRQGVYLLPEEAYNMNMGPNHLVTKELTRQYQLEIARKINITAADSAAGIDAELIPHTSDFLGIGTKFTSKEKLSQSATAQGAGATLLGAANAGYGDKAKLFVQELGKNVALVSQKWRDATVESLSGYVNALRENPRAAAELGILTTALRKSEFRYVFDDPLIGGMKNRIVSEKAVQLAKELDNDMEAALAQLSGKDGSPHSFKIQNAEVADFLRASTARNETRLDKFTTLYNAAGLIKHRPMAGVIYVPPINTVKYPYHAFVKTKEKIGLTSDVGMITARSEEQLRELATSVSDDYDVFFKADTDNYFKAKGEYEYQNTLNEPLVNSDLARRGKLADFFPETRLENIMDDWLGWHAKQEEKLVRNIAQTKNREFFSELELLSKQYRLESESLTRGIGSLFKAKVADPFGDYIKTALNISKQQEFPLLDSLNDFIDKVGIKAGEALNKAFAQANSGMISWEEANTIIHKYGLPEVYRDVDTYIAANEKVPKNLIREFFRKANMALATTTLRLDMFNSLINIISTPIMIGTEMSSIKGLIKNDPELAGKLSELMSIKIPGQNARVPSTTKLLADSISNYFGPAKDSLITRYKDIGAIKEISQIFHDMVDDLAYRPNIAPKQWVENASAGIEKAAKLMGNNFSEDFSRFVAADVMRQLSDPVVAAGRMTVKEQNAYISSFVNRTQGNYVTSQRPIVFQGTTGAAVSLFQTYAFNVLQQLFRHVQAGDKKTLAVFAGLQGSIFGLNGLPFFDAANTYLLGSWLANNPEHKDVYSVLPSFNKELGDWMLYGTASAFPLFTGSFPALFTRGDMNPRHITILPTNIMDVPAVSASIKLVSQLTEFGKNVAGGADLSNAFLRALEHQGWNRPLAGFAQVLAGRSTTSTGSLISAANELETTSMLAAMSDRLVEYGGVTRVLGARPMNEAVALQALYREKRYEAMDKARIERLGEVVKSKLYEGQAPTDEEYEDFMLRYARSGGRIETFNQAYMRWTRDANESVVNQMLRKNENPFSQKLFQIMGGEALSE